VRAAVLGSPITHSLSPVLHAAAYQALGLTWWRYEAIECDEAGLPALLDRCGPDWAGLSLTMPLKRAVIPLLDRIEPLAAEVGAVNTVLLAGEQRIGYNTDTPGLVRALASGGIGEEAPPGPVLILGGGATARAALAALRDLGERSVTVAVRDRGKVADLLSAAERLGTAVTLLPLDPASQPPTRLLISTVPAGASELMAQLFARLDPPPEAVFDVAYHPWPTPLAAAASAAGVPVVGGFELLLHQAALQVELMTGRSAPLTEMRRAGQAELSKRAGLSPA
jgi:shikimate dehydrogenase